MMLHTWVILSIAAAASASWAGNLNYRSPSQRHPALGIAVHKVHKRNNPASIHPADQLNFTHGVASGDPYPDSVILWTRVAPMMDNDASNVTVEGYAPLYNHDTEQYVEASTSPICVRYTVATDEALQDVATSGTLYTSSDIDFTVKVSLKHILRVHFSAWGLGLRLENSPIDLV